MKSNKVAECKVTRCEAGEGMVTKGMASEGTKEAESEEVGDDGPVFPMCCNWGIFPINLSLT